jgi:hypothetical protein
LTPSSSQAMIVRAHCPFLPPPAAAAPTLERLQQQNKNF